MHWRVACMDGGRVAAGDSGAEVEVKTRPRTSRRTRAAHYFASQVRHADATGSACCGQIELKFVATRSASRGLRPPSRLGRSYFHLAEVSSSRCTPERRIANRIAHPISPAA